MSEMVPMKVLVRRADGAVVSYTPENAALTHLFQETTVDVPVRNSRPRVAYSERAAAPLPEDDGVPRRGLADVAGGLGPAPEDAGQRDAPVDSGHSPVVADVDPEEPADEPVPVAPVTLATVEEEIRGLPTMTAMVEFAEARFGAQVNAKGRKEEVRAELLAMARAQFAGT